MMTETVYLQGMSRWPTAVEQVKGGTFNRVVYLGLKQDFTQLCPVLFFCTWDEAILE